jgi:hypothetical protein
LDYYSAMAYRDRKNELWVRSAARRTLRLLGEALAAGGDDG